MCALTDLEWRQITAGVHPTVVGTRTNVILTLILEILLQIAGKSTKRRLNRSIHAARICRSLCLKACDICLIMHGCTLRMLFAYAYIICKYAERV